ncbi:hypothetical protein QUB68_20555 [Microcoleus sp. A006_D1]|uniref:hypothetical protein n=1 Tax=Microcoleus sp. A006_D1 TaxID=3055267 RepID=UPI002FD5B349
MKNTKIKEVRQRARDREVTDGWKFGNGFFNGCNGWNEVRQRARDRDVTDGWKFGNEHAIGM